MQTVEEIMRIKRRRNSSVIPRSEGLQEPIDPFAEPKGISIRIIKDPNTEREVFAQAFPNIRGHPPYLQILYSRTCFTPLPPDYFFKS